MVAAVRKFMVRRVQAEQDEQDQQVSTFDQVLRVQRYYKDLHAKLFWTYNDVRDSLYNPSVQLMESIGEIQQIPDRQVLMELKVLELLVGF